MGRKATKNRKQQFDKAPFCRYNFQIRRRKGGSLFEKNHSIFVGITADRGPFWLQEGNTSSPEKAGGAPRSPRSFGGYLPAG